MAKASFETSVTINAPAEQLYTYLADLPRHTEWSHQPQAMTALTDGPVQVGSQFKTEESLPETMSKVEKVIMSVMMPMMKMMYKFEGYTVAEITALEPNERIAWTSHAPNKQGKKLMRMHWELCLQPQNGSTHVVQRCQMDPPDDSPLAGRVNEDQAEKSRIEVAANLERLKSLVENGGN